MTQRPLHLRQGMLAGTFFAVFMTTWNVLQSPGSRVWAFVLTSGFCAVVLALVFLVGRAVEGRREPR